MRNTLESFLMVIDTLFSTVVLLSIDLIGRKNGILVVLILVFLCLVGSLLAPNIWVKVGLYAIPYCIGTAISIIY